MLASCMAATDLLLHQLNVDTQFQRMDRTSLVSVARTLIVAHVVLIVLRCLGLTLRTIAKLFLRRGILVYVLLFQVYQLNTNVFRSCRVATFALHVIDWRLASLMSCSRVVALHVPKSLRECL